MTIKKYTKNKFVIIAMGLGLLIIGLCVLVFAYKNVTEKPAVTVQQTSTMSAAQVQVEAKDTVVAEGTFVDGDTVHKGSGTAKFVETTTGPKLLFEDFATIPGPDLFVYLSPNNAGEPLGAFASLGRLKNVKGDQVYDLPANFRDYKTVVVWCRAFSVTFTNAQLQYR